MMLFETEATAVVAKVIERSSVRGRLSLIWGSHGVGKTCGIDLAAVDRPWVRRVEPTPGAEKRAPRSFYAELALELGLTYGPNWPAGQIVREIVSYCSDEGLTLVLDKCDLLRRWELDAVRHLADKLGHLVMAGSEAMLTKVAQHPALRAAVRLPYEMPAMQVGEAQNLFGERFSKEFLTTLVTLRGGILNDIMTVIEGYELKGDDTRSLSAADAEIGCRQWLLRMPAPPAVDAKRAA